MADQGAGGEKTEKATPKKRRDAREQGQVRKSQDLASALAVLIMLGVLRLCISMMGGQLVEFAGSFFGYDFAELDGIYSGANVGVIMSEAIWSYVLIILIPLAASLLVGIAVNVVQFGFLFSTKALKPKFGKLNPLKGLKRLVSFQTLFDLVKSIIKLIIICVIIYQELVNNADVYPRMMVSSLSASIVQLADMIFAAAFKIAAVLLIIAVFDFIYQWFKYEKDLKMSKYEVKMEHKQQEGDPMVKGRIQQKQRQMAMMRMMQAVPEADVVITNPTHYAVALSYEEGKATAPKVVAKGKDLVAQRIREIAAENGVEIVEDKPLARSLYSYCEVGDLIPVDMYQAVAEILAQIYRKKKGRS